MSKADALADRLVLVTGAAGTLGRAIAAAIEKAGGTALRSDIRNLESMDYRIDVSHEEDWRDAAEDVERRHGRLDGLVNNAGIIVLGDVERTSYADWRRVQSINVDGVFLGCKWCMPLLGRSNAASIVNISSVSGIVGGANLAAYNASKGAVRLLTKSIALSGARRSPPIRCNSIHPSFVEGEMVETISAAARNAERAYATMRAATPLGRMALAEEIAAAAIYLLGDSSSFVTGAELVIDGGLTAQ